METSNWLSNSPYIENGLMLVGEYDCETDDTLYYDVYSYPEGEKIGRFTSSRFSEAPRKETTNPFIGKPRFVFSVYRDLYPDEEREGLWLEHIHWGIPCVILSEEMRKKMPREFLNRIVEGEPRPFMEIVKEITDKYKKYYE